MKTSTINYQNIPVAAMALDMDPKDLESKLQTISKTEIPETEIRDLLTVKDIAFRGDFSERQVARWIADGKLKSVRFGRRCVRVQVTEWKRFLKGGK